jgi:membrane protein DedA with SNARE-associated domain
MSDFISPGQIDEVIALVTRHGTGWILLFVFASMFIENIFPPYPGDAVIFAAGFISGSGKLGVPLLVVVSVVGSIASILVVYLVGRRYGRALCEKGRLRFLRPEKLPRIEGWFQRYGTALLLASRFLAGTRSLVALSAGIGGVGIIRMAVFSGISVLIWNCLVILSAHHLRSNWEAVYGVFSTYNRAILVAVALLVVLYVVKRVIRRLRAE